MEDISDPSLGFNFSSFFFSCAAIKLEKFVDPHGASKSFIPGRRPFVLCLPLSSFSQSKAEQTRDFFPMFPCIEASSFPLEA